MATSAKQVILDEETKDVLVKIWSEDFDEGGIQQARLAAMCEWVQPYVALMPDYHHGYGVPVGSVVPCRNAIMPYAVGVDIGCGMCAWSTGIKLEDIDVDEFMKFITKNIPVGFSKRSRSDIWLSKKDTQTEFADIQAKVDAACVEFKKEPPDMTKAREQHGTLGGGNHFIELQIDPKTGTVWVMIHSGSRAFGAEIARTNHDKAAYLMDKWHVALPAGAGVSRKQSLEYAFLPTDSDEGQFYIQMMQAACDYALANRAMMMRICQAGMSEVTNGMHAPTKFINIHHNYASQEHVQGKNPWIHRKGATLARRGTIGIIPGSMTTHSYIVEGLGNQESFNSCSHGSGRPYSRTKAAERVQQGLDKSQKDQLGHVKLFGVEEAHDELGSAYKDINDVMNNQTALVSIKHELRPLAVLKGETKKKRGKK